MDAWALGVFMISASVVTTELEYPHALLRDVIDAPRARLAVIGLAMGATPVALIYSPRGRPSGAHTRLRLARRCSRASHRSAQQVAKTLVQAAAGMAQADRPPIGDLRGARRLVISSLLRPPCNRQKKSWL